MSDAVAPDARIENCTGGSTGEPTRFYMTRAQVERYEAARWRGLSWYGITPGSRSVMLWGNPVELSTQRQRRQRLREGLLKNRRVLSAYALGEERLMHDLARLRRYRPAYLYGYATALAALARLLEQSGQTLRLPLRAVVSTSETLAEEQARRFSRLFSCPVVNEYGARDAGILAYSCPHGQLHLTAENCLVEVLDPVRLTPLPAGQTGVLAVTDLYSRAQPRLRYLLGDVAACRMSDAPAAGRCRCWPRWRGGRMRCWSSRAAHWCTAISSASCCARCPASSPSSSGSTRPPPPRCSSSRCPAQPPICRA